MWLTIVDAQFPNTLLGAPRLKNAMFMMKCRVELHAARISL